MSEPKLKTIILGTREISYFYIVTELPESENCEVYWGSHGCALPKNHTNLCECACCDCIEHTGEIDKYNTVCVAKYPYYGDDTWFYGDDVKARGLPAEIEDAPEYWRKFKESLDTKNT